MTAIVAGAVRSVGAVFARGAPSVPGWDRHDLLHPVLRRSAIMALLASYAWLIGAFVAHLSVSVWLGVAAPAATFAAALASLIVGQRYTPRVLLLTSGLWGAAILEGAAGHEGLSGTLTLAAVLATGLLLLPASRALATAQLLVAGGLLLRHGMPVAPLRDASVGLLLLIGIGSSVVQSLRQADQSGLRAWQHAEEAMRRRGELERANKALHEMYSLLQRSNRELELARREAEEARLVKARFAANISHELRTPLNLILGFSRVMYQSPEVYGPVNWTPDLRLDIREIHRASRHLLGMIDDILDLSRIEARRLPLSLQLVSLSLIVNEAAAMARGLLRGSTVEVTASVADGLPDALADRTRIRQVLLNLLTNATRFTTQGAIAVAASLVDSELLVEVSDTGVGIPEADLATIFDEFSQAKAPVTSGPGGAGLGLAICREIVQLHGGRIGVESRVGEGSRFWFTIPLPGSGKARSRLTYNAPAGWQPPLSGGSQFDRPIVVLAADAADAVTVTREVEGFRVVAAGALSELADTVKEEHPQAIVLVSDPIEGKRGPSPSELWKAAGRWDAPLVECEVPSHRSARLRLGVDTYLTKPVRGEDLLAVISDDGRPAPAVLITDDDEPSRLVLRRVLAAALPGATVTTCANAAEALAALRQRHYDLLVADLVMPEVSGVEMLAQARQEGLLVGTKVAIVTGVPYVDEVPPLYPVSLRLTVNRDAGGGWGRCLGALLASVSPDYSRQAPAQPLPAAPLEPQAS